MTTIFILLVVGEKELKTHGGLKLQNTHTRFHENAYCGSKVSTAERKIHIACTQSERIKLKLIICNHT
jgi:hypothetical protein